MNIDVDADGGVATLSGMVSSEVEKQMAHKLAENTSCVYRVNNKLKEISYAFLGSIIFNHCACSRRSWFWRNCRCFRGDRKNTVFYILNRFHCFIDNGQADTTTNLILILDIIRHNSHGIAWSINTEAQPTTKHESNSVTY
ncbi:BON domain-containing protein [Desulfobacter hydrogenophilus]|uniref:BON domain-containing protein n=2 Tax=Desulfobacter hydrogenophilus TaxID=2291 RepID=A0ABX5RJY9_9BACT|nr:BON domain-containing protein [Desulfobacter hydrogenophilus]